MKYAGIVAALLAALTVAGMRHAAVVRAQDEPAKAPDTADAIDEAEVERLIEAFQSKDPVQRDEAYQKLRDMSTGVLPYLHTLLNSTDPDIRRQAENLKRDLQTPPDNNIIVLPGGNDDETRRMIEELMRRFRENGAAARDPFEEMRREMEEFEKEMEALRRHIDEQRKQRAGAPFSGTFSYSTMVNGDRLTYERRADGGVRVEIQNRDQADPEVYAAESWEKFEATYPEIVKRYGLSENGMTGLSIRIGPAGMGRDDDSESRDAVRAPVAVADPARMAPSGAKLSPASDVVAAQLGLKSPAIAVDALDAGAPAYDSLGLRRWDLITHINGQPVAAEQETEFALRQLLADETGTVTVIRQGETLELSYSK